MKLGDMTIKQVARICTSHKCNECPFHNSSAVFGCLLQQFPLFQNLNMEVNIDMTENNNCKISGKQVAVKGTSWCGGGGYMEKAAQTCIDVACAKKKIKTEANTDAEDQS